MKQVFERMKKPILLILMLLLLPMLINAQLKNTPDPINISASLSYSQFQEVKQFVLDKGLTQTYSNVYKDNPYYEFCGGETETIDLYLNPIVQLFPEQKTGGIDYYSVIVLRTPDLVYFNLSGNSKTKEVYLTGYYDTKQSLNKKAKRIEKYIECILSTIEEDPQK